MIRALVPLALLSSLGLAADDLNRSFQFDVHRIGPSFEGHFNGSQNGSRLDIDLKNDLGIQKDVTKVGFGLEYQGPRFAIELSAEEQDYRGSNYLQRDIQIDGSTLHAGAVVDSTVKVTDYTLNWTIRALTWTSAWIGIDLGARVWGLDVTASGYEPLTTVYSLPVEEKVPMPLAQIGFSTGFNAFDQHLVVKGYYHHVPYRGASYRHVGADLRFFPIKWLGARVFTEYERLDVPMGSLTNDLDIRLDRRGTGFGIVLRF